MANKMNVFPFQAISSNEDSTIEFASMEYAASPIYFNVFQYNLNVLTNELNRKLGASIVLSKNEYKQVTAWLQETVDKAVELLGDEALVKETMQPFGSAGRYNTIRAKMGAVVNEWVLPSVANSRDRSFGLTKEKIDCEGPKETEGETEKASRPCIVRIKVTGIWKKKVRV